MLSRTLRTPLLRQVRNAKNGPSPLGRQDMLDLDQQIKERILHQSQDDFKFDTEKFKEGLRSAYMMMTQEMYQDKRHIEAFKQQVILEEEDPLTRAQQQQEKEQDTLLSEYMNKGTQEEQLEKLKRARQAVRDQKHWDAEEDSRLGEAQQYGHYDKFEGFWAGHKDRAYDSGDDVPGSAIGRTFSQMAEKLQKEEGTQFVEHQQYGTLLREQRNQSIEGRPADADLLREEDMANQQSQFQYQEYLEEADFTRVSYDIMGEDDESDTEINMNNPFVGRLSPAVKENIFQLHRQGVSLKEISDRFGILPERIKVIIWQKQTFYDEILPRVSLSTVRLAIEAEEMYNAEFGFEEYGIDLPRLMEREKGMHMKHFVFDALDVSKHSTQEVRQRMADLANSKKKKKYELVQEKFVGEAHKGYFVKEWKWYRGKGTDRTSRIFQRTLRHSHTPHRLPLKVQAQLQAGKGPREAVYRTKHVSR